MGDIRTITDITVEVSDGEYVVRVAETGNMGYEAVVLEYPKESTTGVYQQSTSVATRVHDDNKFIAVGKAIQKFNTER